MIPNIIHYCWFGPKSISREHKNYIQGWMRLMPGHRLVEWNEQTTPKSPYLLSAIKRRKWANASNWARLYALREHGGIYLDTDIEMLQPLTPFLDCEAFVGFEVRHFDWAGCVNNAVFGAEKSHWFVAELLERIERDFDGTEEAHLSSPHLTTNVLREHGLIGYGSQNVKGVSVFPVETFYPYGWHEIFNPDLVTDDSFTIHWYSKSWTKTGTPEPFRRRVKKAWNLLRWHLWARRKTLNRLMLSTTPPKAVAETGVSRNA